MTENKLKINEYTFNDQFYNYLIEYSREADYNWGETEFVLQTGYLAGTPVKPSAMVHEIDPSSEVHKHVDGRIKELYPELTGYEPMRMYINCFAPREYSNFHTDGNCKTILVYLADRPWDPSFCGETQFLYEDFSIQGVAPIPNRSIFFDGMILHKAVAYKEDYRFTLAIKYVSGVAENP